MKSFRSLWGQNYVNSNWLGYIQSISIGQNIFLKATVSPSQPGVGRADYSAWILIVPDGDHCTCPAGLGKACSHISAIGYAVVMAWSQGFAGKSVTDFPVSWGKGATSSDHQAELKEIDFSRPNKNKPITEKNINVRNKPQKEFRFQKLESHNELIEFSRVSTLSKLFSCKNTIVNKILNSEIQSDKSAEICRNLQKSQMIQGAFNMEIMIWIIQNQLKSQILNVRLVKPFTVNLFISQRTKLMRFVTKLRNKILTCGLIVES